jgi:predicted  nucleic acid-binding Zn-ribbon protein
MPHQCTNCDRTFADGSKEMLSGCPECGGTKFQFRPDGFDSAAGETDSPSESDAEPEPPERPGDAMTRTVGSAAATVKDLVSGNTGPDASQARAPAASDSTQSAASDPTQTAPDAAQTPAASEPSTQAGDGSDDDIIVAESAPASEDTAQADARSEVATPGEVPAEGFEPTADDPVGDDPTTESEADAADTADVAVDTGSDDSSDENTEPESDDSAASESEPTDDGRTVAAEPDAERTDRPDLAQLREELNEQFESIRVVEPGQYELNLMELYDREEYIIALQEDGRYSIQVPEAWREADA